MSLKRIIDVGTVSQLLKKNIINKEGVRLFDCSYAVGKKPDWKKFKAELYGNFKEILAQPSLSKQLYLSGHIPEAAFMSLDAALFPSQYERFALYPPDIFEKYIQMIGVNEGEHIILYARGALGGMVFSSRIAWLLKSYGHDPEKVSLLDGGLASWMRQGLELSTEDVQLPPGNWKAHDKLSEYNIKFEEMEDKDGDKVYLERTDEVNFLDARHRGQFNGTEDTGLDPYRILFPIYFLPRARSCTVFDSSVFPGVGGSNIPGFKNAPAAELVNDNGQLKSKDEIRQWLYANGYKSDKPVVTLCNTGMQASMLAQIISYAVPEISPRVYNGSMKEMELRDPKRISGGRSHLPS
ncbi:hypothetical protein Y032_0051g2130 [Ancylostoma ceylanicum]|uniref:Rhodanese domain-containing protein n=1 Tax=Ancylostoma ceylanicum TaxID=53326 RepID=A0A016U8V8_9BILA|nr:hypothetical protein Y032_0051g2130 [Ancylostoma ceylanicum]